MATTISLTLREMRTTREDGAQSPEDALDVLPCRSVVVQVRREGRGADGAKVVLQHAAVREEAAFMDLQSGEFALDGTASDSSYAVFNDTLRYLRWRTENLQDTDTTFCIDLLGRS
jgi:hypothetical protein